MFDDVPANLPTGPASAPESTPPPIIDEGQVLKGSTDGTLAMPEPVEQATPSPASPMPAVDDMFDTVDPVASAAPAPTLPAATPVGPAKRATGKLVLLVIGMVLLLGVVGVGAAFFLGAFDADEPVPTTTTTPTPAAGKTPAKTPSTPPPTTPVVEPTDKLPEEPELDSDGDGLTDAEEARYGTLIHKPDSDNDGLFDREEIMVYRTNALSADTDGDGFLDGAEVQSGYNPNGPGKLTDLPQ